LLHFDRDVHTYPSGFRVYSLTPATRWALSCDH
jgi:hypothetical protein